MHAAATEDRASGRRVRGQCVRGLYAVTPDLADTRVLLARVAAALAGGASAIQYRNKTASRALQREQASALASLVAASGATFIVNDDPELAREVGADGVHVGEDDADLARARSMLGAAPSIIGVSCYNDFARAERAAREGADYIAFGSFFPSPTKPAARRAGTDLIVRARALGVPVVAIGGITAHNAPLLIEAGADAIAVISAVFDAPDSTAAARALAQMFDPRAARAST